MREGRGWGTVGSMRSLVVALALGAFFGGCASAQQPCDQLSACPGALVCQVGRCASVEAVPVRPEAGRLVLAPLDAFYIDGASTEGVASEVRAGSEAGGGALMLLRFSPSWEADQIERAYLILEPVEGAIPTQSRVTLEVAPILEPWSSRSPSPLPRLGTPEGRAIVSFSPPQTARIDVTELVKGWAQRKSTIHGLAVRATATGSDVGARFGWDDAHGTGPRLDLYTR